MKTKQVKQAARKATERADRKTAYTPPQVEIIQMDMEGVIATSGNISGFDTGNDKWGTPTSTVSTRRVYNSASGNDLEDLINDILTVEQ